MDKNVENMLALLSLTNSEDFDITNIVSMKYIVRKVNAITSSNTINLAKTLDPINDLVFKNLVHQFKEYTK